MIQKNAGNIDTHILTFINYGDRKGEGVSTKCQFLLMLRVKKCQHRDWL